ncbi:transposase [Streptomyces massasporeus]|uniref:transposase n=1 Tax=Streptomyces massasporeus TaxID=67324 RepID=UPI0036B00287
MSDAVLCEGAGSPRWTWRCCSSTDVGTKRCRRPEPRPDRCRPAAVGAGRGAAAAFRGRGARPLAVDVSPWLRSDGAVLGRAAVLPCLGPGEDGLAVHPGQALLLCCCAGAGRHVLDRDPRRGAARAGGRRHRGHRAQLRGVVQRLITADQRQAGNQHIVIVSDADYDVTRLAWVLYDLHIELVGQVRSDRVMEHPRSPRLPGPCSQAQGAGPGRPPGAKNRHRAPRYDVGSDAPRPSRPSAAWKILVGRKQGQPL